MCYIAFQCVMGNEFGLAIQNSVKKQCELHMCSMRFQRKLD